MNLDRAGAVALAQQVAARAAEFASRADLAVFPPSVYLDPVHQALGNAAVGLGGQNVYFEKNGAFTGETSTAMLLDVGLPVCAAGPQRTSSCVG